MAQQPRARTALRNKTESSGKQAKLGKTEDAPEQSRAATFFLSACKCLLRGACSRLAPALIPPALPMPDVRSVGVHRLSAIPRTLHERSNPPLESDEDEGKD